MRFFLMGMPDLLTQADSRFRDMGGQTLQDWTTQPITPTGAYGDLGHEYYADVTPPAGWVLVEWSLVGQATPLGFPDQNTALQAQTQPNTVPLPGPLDSMSDLQPS